MGLEKAKSTHTRWKDMINKSTLKTGTYILVYNLQGKSGPNLHFGNLQNSGQIYNLQNNPPPPPPTKYSSAHIFI